MRVTHFRSASLILVALATAVASLSAQDDPHAACSAVGWVPREILERPVPLRPGVGNSHEPVTTSSKEAQAFYHQGLNYLHGYVWIEAARSFRQALRLDPGLAMAYVGLSRVYSGLDDPAGARTALDKARTLEGQASGRERRRIALRATQLDALADISDASKHAEYKKALDAALAADISDPELWLLRGNAEEPTAAGRGQRGGAASTAFYLAVLRLAPDHGAAHHYLTHSYETISQISLALEHGEVYARMAPAIPHSHHMWGHDLRRVGRIDDAITAFRKTDELEKRYYKSEDIPPGLDWHHVHNLDLLATAYQHKGRMKQAEATMREASALPPVTDYLEFNQKALTVFLLGRQRWTEALAAARVLEEGQWPATRVVGRSMAGHALLALGRAHEAEGRLADALRDIEALPRLSAGISIARGQVQPYADTLRGEILLRAGKVEEARALLKEVQRTLRSIPGPDAWIQALFRLEAIARTAREVGDWELADYTAGQMLEHDTAYAGAHLAAALVARHKGDTDTAARELAAAQKLWPDADPDLPELAEARSLLRQTAGR